MRIAFVLSGLGAGGAERVVSLISSHWAELGWHVTVIAFDSPADPIFHDFSPGIEMVRLNVPSLGAASAFRRARALRAALKRIQPDTVISFLTKVNVLTLLATLGTDFRVIVSERNNARLQSVNRTWNMLLTRLYRRAGHIVIQTEASRACLPQGDQPRATVIPNPVRTLPEPVLSQALCPSRIVAVGRLTEQKGFDRLLMAFAQIAPRHLAWQLVIWGEGPAKSTLLRHAQALGIADRVSLPGLSATPGDWINATDVFVLPSRFEGFPNVLAEAMAAGLPVIAFDCDFGPAEMITNGVDGMLVPQNSVAGLSRALDLMLSDSVLRTRLGTAAHRSVERFAVEPILERWTRLVLSPSSHHRDEGRSASQYMGQSALESGRT